jgi:DNA repair protein RadC
MNTNIYTIKLVKDRTLRYSPAKITNHNNAAGALRAILKDKDVENLAVALVDANSNLIGLHLISSGSLSRMVASVRDVMKIAIIGRASGIVLGHNHPSGQVKPSQEDIEFTHAVNAASKLMGVSFIDHVIVSSGINDDIFSFFAAGILV